MRTKLPMLLTTSWVLIANGCQKGGDSTTSDDAAMGEVTLEGAVQKGPFVVGSSVQVSLLDATLGPTGQVFNTSTLNDRGEFSISFETSGPVALEGVGFYYNEVKGALSGSSLTLRAFYVPSGSGTQSVYINLVTHLTAQRIQTLVQNSVAFAAAVSQSESELLGELGITYADFQPTVRGIDMNVAGGDTDDNAYLLAVSSVFAQGAAMRASGSDEVDATLQELINSAALAFAEGTFPPELKTDIDAALLAMDVEQIAQKLAERLVEIGSGKTVPDMNRVLDQDHDSARNLDDNCPAVANLDQADGDDDGYGDLCDDCPSTVCTDECRPANSDTGLLADACYQPCASDDEGDCATGDRCVVTGEIDTEGGRLLVCGSTCDPRSASSCPENHGCFRLEPASPMTSKSWPWICISSALHSALPLASACALDATGEDPCGSGLACGVSPESSFTACRTICDPDSDTACDGLACTEWQPVVPTTGTPDPSEYALGLCELSPGSEGDACSISTWTSSKGMTELLDSCGDNLVCEFSDSCPPIEGLSYACCVPAE